MPDENVSLCHALGGQDERQRERGKQPFRHHGDDDADGENEILPEWHMNRGTNREEG